MFDRLLSRAPHDLAHRPGGIVAICLSCRRPCSLLRTNVLQASAQQRGRMRGAAPTSD
jgi:hypothetical protein